MIMWYETVFDIMHGAFLHLGRPKDLCYIKNHLELQVYGIPGTAINYVFDILGADVQMHL